MLDILRVNSVQLNPCHFKGIKLEVELVSFWLAFRVHCKLRV